MEISKETLSLINAFKSPIIKLISDVKDEVEFYFSKSLINYVETIRNKYITTKTFLFRQDKVDFYDTYFPITLKFKKENEIIIDDIDLFFKNSNFISVIGNAGSGKSMLMKHIFLKSIKQIVKIPLVVELRDLNDINITFTEYIYKIIAGKKIIPNNKIIERIIANGDFIFLLDGYDEIYNENKGQLINQLNEFIDNNSKNYFLITSRPGANIETLPRFENYYVNNLSEKQIEKFIHLQSQIINDKKLGDKIIQVINKKENTDYKSYLSSPLLLSMFMLTFKSYPELPKSKNKFYWNVYDTLCTKHDTFTKHGGFLHERKTGLQDEDFEDILKWFAYTSLFKGRYSFDSQYFTTTLKRIKSKLNLKCNINDLKDDLTVAISIIIIDGLEYKFPHKSLQEYFTALLIKEQKEEYRTEIYSKKIAELSRFSFGNNNNFWNLCLEIDEINFKTHFLLTHLKGIINSIDFSNNENICKSFMNLGHFSQGFDYDNKKIIFNRFSWQNGIELLVLEYLGLYDIRNLSLNRNKKISKQISDLILLLIKNKEIIKIGKKKETITYEIAYSKWSTDLYEFVKITKVELTILSIIENIQNKIIDIENEINVKEKQNLDLLGM